VTPTVHKVTCFIIRTADQGIDLLLFSHPHVGVQIPAGTVNPGEDIETAARREAAEETGLNSLVLLRKLAEADDPPPDGFLLTTHSTTVYSRPDIHSIDWAHFRSGLPVKLLRHTSGFTQVCYAEDDRYIDPQYTSYNITGWVPDEALTAHRMRHFFLFTASRRSPDRWKVPVDYTTFELFWAPLDHLPPIVSPQDGWLKWLKDLSPGDHADLTNLIDL
jgi:8-oxo-dGTP pyrophosphatase MutT (NUDIX family)